MIKSDATPEPPASQWVAVILALALFTVLAYLPVFQADFVNYDDQAYVTENTQVQAGLSWAGLKWAFTTGEMGNWHPVTWLSLMLDVQCFGVNAPAHHAVNLGLHVANVVLIFLLLARLTGRLWPSAFAAVLFALHPVHVESVAWISERKDVLSTCFGLLSLLAYARYAQPSALVPRPSTVFGFARSPAYWLAGLFLILGLMSKAMLVTWPLLMLLLDFWPFRRVELPLGKTQIPQLKRLLLEKLPLFVLVGLIAVVTVQTQHRSEAVISLEQFPLSNRLENVIHSIFVYIVQFLWPQGLAPFYPFDLYLPALRVLLAAVVVVGFSVAALLLAKRHPWFPVGWFWFLISLLPVSGLVHVGLQAHADRYLYVPSIGLGWLVVWAGTEFALYQPRVRNLVLSLGLCAGGLLGWLTYRQARLWQNTEALFTHALAVTQNNFIAHQSLGEELLKQGKFVEARQHFEAALAINPRMPTVQNNIAVMLLRDGKFAEAAAEFAEVLSSRPNYHTARYNQAQALEGLGQFEKAMAVYREYLAGQPQDIEAHLAVTRCLARLGRNSEALQQLQSARQSFPKEVRIYTALAVHWASRGNVAEAIAEYERGLAASPDSPELCNNLAWLLATHSDQQFRNGDRAVQLAAHACQLTANQQPFLLGTLAAAYAEAGRFADAVATAQRAIELARTAGQTELATRNAELLELYRASKPYREPAPAPTAGPAQP